MRRIALLASIALAAVLLTGCTHVTQDWVLNPDGTGKVDFLVQVNTGRPAGTLPRDLVARQIHQFMTTSYEEVAAFRDVRWRMQGQIVQVEGTAYFHSPEDVPTWIMAQFGETPVGLMGVVPAFVETEEGGTRLTLGYVDPEDKTEAEDDAETDGGTAEETIEPAGIVAALSMRARDLGLPLLEGNFRFHLPGRPGKAVCLEVVPVDRIAEYGFRGPDLIRGIQNFVRDEADFQAAIDAGWHAGTDEDRFALVRLHNQRRYGTAAVASVEILEPMEPLFDFEAELETAKAAWPENLRELGFDAIEAEAPAAEETTAPDPDTATE
jgi:hypothetical protein